MLGAVRRRRVACGMGREGRMQGVLGNTKSGVYSPNGNPQMRLCSLPGFNFIHSFRKPIRQLFEQGSCAGPGGNMPPGGSESQGSSLSLGMEAVEAVASK